MGQRRRRRCRRRMLVAVEVPALEQVCASVAAAGTALDAWARAYLAAAQERSRRRRPHRRREAGPAAVSGGAAGVAGRWPWLLKRSMHAVTCLINGWPLTPHPWFESRAATCFLSRRAHPMSHCTSLPCIIPCAALAQVLERWLYEFARIQLARTAYEPQRGAQ